MNPGLHPPPTEYRNPGAPRFPPLNTSLPSMASAPSASGGASTSASAGPGSGKKKARAPQATYSPHSKSALDLADGPPDLNKVRAYAACKACRSKKVKCIPGPSASRVGGGARGGGGDDAATPGPCQQCIQAKVECTYPPTRDRAAYSRQYVQNLENRVNALEGMSARLMPLLEAFEAGGGGGAVSGGNERLSSMNMQGMMSGRSPRGQGYGLPLPQTLDEVMLAKTEQARLHSRGSGTGTADQRRGSGGSGSRSRGRGPGDEEDEDEGDDDAAAGSGSDEEFAEDAGQMTQDEHGNYRWIGSSNTLSLLDSFAAGPSPRTHHPSMPGAGAAPGVGTISGPGGNGRTEPQSASNPYFAPVAGSGVVKALPTVDEVMYPSPTAAAEMIDAYFEEIHPILPVVIEQEFRESYKALMERRARGVPESSGIFISVVFAIFALGERVMVTSRAWQRERSKVSATAGQDGVKTEPEETVLPGEAEAGVVWYERAQILRYTTITDISLHQVQSLILMATFQASVNAMPMSWLLCGIALRMAQDLGLHRSTARLKLSIPEKQIRSRVWWAAYGLDRMLSLTLGRPPGVDDLDIDVSYPAEIDDAGIQAFMSPHPASSSATSAPSPIPAEPPAAVMSGFVALTKLCKLAGRISHILYRPSHGRSVQDPNWLSSQQNAINKLDNALREWLENEVPAKYKDQNPHPTIQLVSAVLSNSYFACLITLHRNFLPPSPDSSRARPPPSSTSLSHCVAAARSVIHIAAQSKILLPPTHHLAVFCQYLWSAAVMLLLCEVRAKDQVVMDAVKPQVDSCRRSLQALEPVWPGARKLRELISEAERRGREVAVSEASGTSRPQAKKRKSSSQDRMTGSAPPHKRASLQASSLGDGRRASSNSSPIKGGSSTQQWSVPLPARSNSARAYETSDTRNDTMAAPTDIQSLLNHASASVSGAPFMYAQNTLPLATPTMDYSLSTLNNGGNQGYTFDTMGVDDFAGLEMLQGLNTDFATIWSTLMAEPMVDTSALSSPQQTLGGTAAGGAAGMSGISFPMSAQGGLHHAPGATPISAGPSPHASSAQWLSSPQLGQASGTAIAAGAGAGAGAGMMGVGGGYTALPDLASSEFWSQVAAAGQDWGADPNVPFSFDGLR